MLSSFTSIIAMSLKTLNNIRTHNAAQYRTRIAKNFKSGNEHVNIFSQDCEIRRLREASVTSDGMLSCYTPFLLAIVRRRIAAAVAARKEAPPSPPKDGLPGDISLTGGGASGAAGCCAGDESPGGGADVIGSDSRSRGGSDSGNGSDVGDDGPCSHAGGSVDARGEKGSTSAAESLGETGGGTALTADPAVGVGVVDTSCPRALCAEALWALSEYAVLSPELAAGEVLPLAEVLATGTLEHAQVLLFFANNAFDIYGPHGNENL